MKFFSPTSDLKELLLLQHIENNPDTTQSEIAKVIGGAASMVNVYIDRLEEDGYMVRDYKSAKIVDYNITPEGIKRKNYLLIVYMQELLKLYKLAKENVENFLSKVEDRGFKDILLYGAGEVSETIIGVITEREKTNLKVIAIIDDDIEKQGENWFGYKVMDRSKISKCNHDAIVITSYTFEEDILNRLKEIDYDISRVIRFFGVN